MAFTSLSFAAFLITAAVVYYIVPRNMRWIMLLLISYVFYLSAGVGVLGYILFTTLTTYFCGILIGKYDDDGAEKAKKAQLKKKRNFFAAVALLLNFGLLYVVKYWNFTLDLFHIQSGALRFGLIMPLGISFYIFQSMGYIIDLVRRKYKPQKNLLKLALFVSFFPQLTQGPIGRYDALAPQLYSGNSFSFDNIKEGLKLLIRGYIKKMVIADRAAIVACAIIDNHTSYSGSVILFGIIFYCIQLYCDFSGGIDVARGVARIFGIEMAQNFLRPLFATSLADFWRRWHITLGGWLRDYLFYPITLSKPFIKLGKFSRKYIKGKAGKILPTSLATFIVYFVIGIWHGASWKYILFGCWNGVIITAALLMEPIFIKAKKALRIDSGNTCYRVFCIIRTSAIVVLGRYITRAETVKAATQMLAKTFADFSPAALFSGTLMSLGLGFTDYMVILAGCLILFVFELAEEKGISLSEKIERKGYFPTFLFASATIFVFLYFGVFRGNYISSEFIYKQF